MCSKLGLVKLPSINKEIIEVKKRIQLSEGQRKALFAEIETERKRDADELLKLKKEIQSLTLSVQEYRKNVALRDCGGTVAGLVPASRLRSVIGHVSDKTTLEEMCVLLDLQHIDRTKRLDLLKYTHKQKETKLKSMAEKYQKLLMEERNKIHEERNNDANDTSDLRNRINAVLVQMREAELVRTKYKDIKWSLSEDAAKFESKIRALEEEIKMQDMEIHGLNKINLEATRKKNEARNALVNEEKQVLASGSQREKQANEGKRLVEARASDLEKLERLFYQPKRSANNEEEDTASDLQSSEDPLQPLLNAFETLKNATGGGSPEEVFQRFKMQRQKCTQLITLRQGAENLKLEKQNYFQTRQQEYEMLKFAESKETQSNGETVDELKSKVEHEETKKCSLLKRMESMDGTVKKIGEKLRAFYCGLNKDFKEVVGANNEPAYFIEQLKATLLAFDKQSSDDGLHKQNTLEHLLQELGERENDKWLPQPYNDIVRRTPAPHTPTMGQAPVVGSEEEEEPPTRGFLKRQAQLVIDAKNRRKNRYPNARK